MYETDRVQVAHSAYVREGISDDPLVLIARVYRFAHVQARRARSAIEQGDTQTKANAIHRLLNAIALLQGSLNTEAGGDVASNLDRLYAYFAVRISAANVNNDSEAVREVESYLADLAGAWVEVSERKNVQEAK